METRTQGQSMGELVILEKQPRESRLFDVDFADDLLSGDSITVVQSVTVANKNNVDSSLLPSVDSENINGSLVQLRLSGGTNQEQYLITVLISTSLGDTLEGDGLLNVLERG